MLFIAPFERGLSAGGSQRATAIAEAMEARGAEVDWSVAPPTVPSQLRRAVASIAGPPMPALVHRPPVAASTHDIRVACHSYLGEAVVAGLGLGWVDFQNVEVDHMNDLARGLRGPKRLYWRRQARLMAKLERHVADRADVVSVATTTDAAWVARSSSARPLVVPNVLPAAEANHFREIRALRSPGRGDPELVFIGTLDYLPNVHALDRFLQDEWPTVHEHHPTVRLSVIGRCAEADAARWGRHRNVTVLGFVPDLRPVLGRCTAAVLPLDMAAGSSLRVLALGLAGVPVIGSPQAFRGHTGPAMVARSPDDWVRCVDEVRAAGPSSADTAALGWAEARQQDVGPFEALWSSLTGCG